MTELKKWDWKLTGTKFENGKVKNVSYILYHNKNEAKIQKQALISFGYVSVELKKIKY